MKSGIPCTGHFRHPYGSKKAEPMRLERLRGGSWAGHEHFRQDFGPEESGTKRLQARKERAGQTHPGELPFLFGSLARQPKPPVNLRLRAETKKRAKIIYHGLSRNRGRRISNKRLEKERELRQSEKYQAQQLILVSGVRVNWGLRACRERGA